MREKVAKIEHFSAAQHTTHWAKTFTMLSSKIVCENIDGQLLLAEANSNAVWENSTKLWV